MQLTIIWWCFLLCSVRLCETAGRQGDAQIFEWSCFSWQSTKRSAAERLPRNALHWVHGPWHLASGSLQRWTQPRASITPQHSHRWEDDLHLHRLQSFGRFESQHDSAVWSVVSELFVVLSSLSFHLWMYKNRLTCWRVQSFYFWREPPYCSSQVSLVWQEDSYLKENDKDCA